MPEDLSDFLFVILLSICKGKSYWLLGFHQCAHTVPGLPITPNIANHCIYYKIWSQSEVNNFIFLPAQYQESESSKLNNFCNIYSCLSLSRPRLSRPESHIFPLYIHCISTPMSLTSFKSTLGLSCPSFSVRRYIFHHLYYSVS